jgi:hypothetical protein
MYTIPFATAGEELICPPVAALQTGCPVAALKA